jgi:GNAT superfamily N-acetyltransferase
MSDRGDDHSPSEIVLHIVPLDDEQAQELEARLIADIVQRYGPGGPGPVPIEDFSPPRGCFVVGVLDSEPVCCGGFRHLRTGVAEIKRMYVDPSVRGRGIGRRMLCYLEEHAVAAGYGETWLETGTEQPEAISLYVSVGYLPLKPYGEFKDDERNRSFYRSLTG